MAGMQGPGGMSARAARGMLTALVPALLMNVCIVGINQIFDVAIDKARPPGTRGRQHACALFEPLLSCSPCSSAAVAILLDPNVCVLCPPFGAACFVTAVHRRM